MSWTERQHALLQGMGLRLWTAPERANAAPQPQVVQAAPMLAKPAVAADTPAASIFANVATVANVENVQRVATPARGDALPGMDWAELRSTVAECRACGLCEGRTQTVFGTGSEQAHWMVVGEAPGEEEDLSGEPFVGPSGQLLDRMLAALSLSRNADEATPPEQRVYIANSVKCRPPRNRNPTPEELQRCEPFLVRQIELLRPRVIMAMGRIAVQTLLCSDQPLGKLRGQVHRYQGVPLVVSYHPAYLLRQPLHKAAAWEDLCLAAQVAEGKG